jgi:3-dehydrosphinganine reductase
MELRPYNIYVSVAYPPDTDTPGYEVEMQSKPEITKKLSESGTLFSSVEVATNIVEYADRGYYGISTGFDGWMLKYLHPGMSPVSNLWEVWSGLFLTPLFRLISVGYLLYFDQVVRSMTAAAAMSEKGSGRDKGREKDKKKGQ